MSRDDRNEGIRLWSWADDRRFEEKFGVRVSKLDCDLHLLNKHPVGMLLDSIDPERNMGHRASTEQLLEVAHAGQHLFRSAIIEAAEADDTAFFVELFEEEREEVNTVLQGFGYDTRCSECGGILRHTGECARS